MYSIFRTVGLHLRMGLHVLHEIGGIAAGFYYLFAEYTLCCLEIYFIIVFPNFTTRHYCLSILFGIDFGIYKLYRSVCNQFNEAAQF